MSSGLKSLCESSKNSFAAHNTKCPALKRILRARGFFRSAKALLPPNKFGGCHRDAAAPPR